ncbi:MAG: sensor histidine kinase [Anaerofustis sp.]
MNLKFKTRLVLLNVGMILVIVSLICFVIVQGTTSYLVGNQVSNMSVIADESSILITQSIRSTQVSGQDDIMYRTGASFYAKEIAQIYSMQVMLFDNATNLVGSSSDSFSSKNFISYATAVLQSAKKSYVYTTIDNTNYIVLFSPVTIDGTTVGISALFFTTTQIDRMVHQIVLLFLYTGIFAALLSMIIYTHTYDRMLVPIKKIAKYNRAAVKGKTIEPPNIPYNSKDEIRELIDSSTIMVEQINDKIADANFEKEKLLAVISSLEDAVIAVNLSNEILTTNRKLSEFFPAESNYFSVIPHFDETIQKVIVSRENVSYEFEFGGKNFLMSGNLIASANKEDGVLIVIKDVTALKKIEDEQNKFISSVSHELKTPLTTIIGYIDMLQRRGTQDEQMTEKALRTAKKESQRLLRLVNDLLNINRYHSIDFDFIFTNIDPNVLIEEAVSEMNIKGSQNDTAVIYTQVPLPEIKGDYDRLKQVLINVIDNAIKYSKPDDIVKVTATFDEKELEITVRDFGDGIPEEMQEKVFDTFYRVEEDRSRLRGGFGLGLSIVKNIISKHNGTVKIESMPGQGTLVVIRLPLISSKGENV